MAGAPQLLVPPLATLVAGALLFVALAAFTLRKVAAREGERPAWDAPAGALLGGAWGTLLVLLVLVGLASVGRLDRAMRQGMIEAGLRTQRRHRAERNVERRLAPLVDAYTPAELELRRAELVQEALAETEVEEVEVLEQTDPGPLDGLLAELDHSPLGTAVEMVSPVGSQAEDTLRDLTVVAADPVLFDRFQHHPEKVLADRYPGHSDPGPERTLSPARAFFSFC